MIEGQSPLKHRPVIDRSESVVVGRKHATQLIKHSNPAIVESGSAVAITEVVALKPSVGPENAGNSRALVHEPQNILEVEEEPVETGGVVAPASRGNEVGAPSQRLVWKKCVGREIEALPQNSAVGGIFEEYEVAGGGAGGPHLQLTGVGEYEVTGFEKGERGAFSVNRLVPPAVNVGLGDDSMTSSLKFSTEREKEDEAWKVWKKMRGMRRAKHSVEAAINEFSHVMKVLIFVDVIIRCSWWILVDVVVRLKMTHSCSSSTCNGWWKKNPNLICRGGGGSKIDGVSSVCLCGEKSILRTARTPKNRGKQFWGCRKYKNGNEDGDLNYF
ncbi:hypothetical protein V8G54_010763 [Vigna mungo]|uniref:GRF-type domain-containing protein n=1 Tax=Vigna mungo TaxID=3915 RepID=A0AAQ3NZ43_VIGMU